MSAAARVDCTNLRNRAFFTKNPIDEDDQLRAENNRLLKIFLPPDQRLHLGPRQQQGPDKKHQ